MYQRTLLLVVLDCTVTTSPSLRVSTTEAEVEAVLRTRMVPLSRVTVPLAAADEDGFVWMAVDGKVQKKAFEWNLCSRTHAQADAEWSGQTVILYPDRYHLRDGMNIQVAE